MNLPMSRRSRRAFLGTVATTAAFFTVKGAVRRATRRHSRANRGAVLPRQAPLDTDNDLIIINDSITPAVGEITHLSGASSGRRVRRCVIVTIEIWQCDANEVYLHTGDSDAKKDQQDKNFQGFGRFTTGATGEYRFRTIKPVPYPGRPALTFISR